MKKRIIKICAVCFISLIICLQFLVYASAYSEDYPDYLDIGNCAFIECNTNIGAGTFVFPLDCREDKISYFNSYLQNVTGSYISGKFILYDNTVYDVRAQNLSNFQYIYKNGYNTEYRDISVNSITNTNIKKLKKQELYTYGNNGVYTKEILDNDNIIINKLSNNKSKYCLLKEKNSTYLNICNNNNMLVVIPSIIGGYNNIKNNLTGGSIILLEDTSNIDIIIKYINSKGYTIVPLSKLLTE